MTIPTEVRSSRWRQVLLLAISSLILLLVGFLAGRGSRTEPNGVFLDCSVRHSLSEASVRVRINGLPPDSEFGFEKGEDFLGVSDVRAFDLQGNQLALSDRVTLSGEGGGASHWYRPRVPIRDLELHWTVRDSPQKDHLGRMSRQCYLGTTRVLMGSQILPDLGTSAPIFGRIRIEETDLVGGSSTQVFRDAIAFHHMKQSVFASGASVACRSREGNLYLSTDYSPEVRADFCRAFSIFQDVLRSRVPAWDFSDCDIVLVPRKQDTVPLVDCRSSRTVVLDADRPYPRVWAEAFTSLQGRRSQGHWVSLGLAELLGAEAASAIEGLSRDPMQRLRSNYERNRRLWDEDLRASLEESGNPRWAEKVRRYKSALILDLAHRSLVDAGLSAGIWQLLSSDTNSANFMNQVAHIAGPSFASVVSSWLHPGSFQWCSIPELLTSNSKPLSKNREAAFALDLAFTGSANGQLETCGCSPSIAGGLARRARLLSQLRRETPRLIHLELGNALPDLGPRVLDPVAEAERRVFVSILQSLRVDAWICGESEILRGLEDFKHFTNTTGLELVCSNLEPKGTMPASKTINLDGKSIVIIGYSANRSDPDSDRVFGDYRDAITLQSGIESILAEAKEAASADLIVLAGWIDGQIIHQIAVGHPGLVDIIISDDPTARDTGPLETRTAGGGFLGRTLVLYHVFGPQAVSHARIEMFEQREIKSFRLEIAQMSAEVEKDEATQERLTQFYREIAAIEQRAGSRAEPLTKWDPEFAGHFVGTDACRKCHLMESDQFDLTKHSKAFSTLITANRQYTSKCTPCHVVGFGYPGGWRPEQPREELRNVGCESCHGPGRAHALEPSSKNIRKTPFEETCQSCHDSKHSPGFAAEVETRMKSIRHVK